VWSLLFQSALLDNSSWCDHDVSCLLACDQFLSIGSNIDFNFIPTLDTLHNEELATVDPGMRQQIFLKIHQIYLTELPFIVLYSQSFPYIVHEGM
jgi:ABC-type transport system substrate-binding protein